MSRFFSPRYAALAPYTPGEQPQDQQYVKLNTNESPFPPSPRALAAALERTRPLNLYSDPDCRELRERLAALCGVGAESVIVANGSDEVLDFAFRAFCDDARPALFPDVTYGFYPVFADVNGLPYREIPLRDDFTLDLDDYRGTPGTVFLANPNAPTGKALPRAAIGAFAAADPDRVVVVDEAYVDFGAESCVPLTARCDNLLVVQTFSKSRSMAGARLGFAVGSPELIADLNALRCSTNPYNVNSATLALGAATLEDPDYTRKNCEEIMRTRAYATEKLRALGFEVPESSANFVFARSPRIGGGALYEKLKARGVLVRHFTKARIADYNRITIGTREQMDILFAAISDILEETP